MLSDLQIQHAIRYRGLEISGYNTVALQAASYDVRLHPQLLLLDGVDPLDPKTDTSARFLPVTIPEDGYTLRLGQFALGSTSETVTIGDQLVGQLEGKSSLGRLGLMVHSTAGYLDPGFIGQVTLELSVVHGAGIVLYPGMPIGQIAFDNCCGVKKPYKGKYLDQVGPTPSRYHLNWTGERWK